MSVKEFEKSTKEEKLGVKSSIYPQDLMSLKELHEKHGYNYDYLYKYSILKGDITVYFRGTWKLSETEVLEFSRNIAEKKLNKLRTSKGGK